MSRSEDDLRRLIEEIEQQEATLVFHRFANADAWRLGCALVAKAEAEQAPVAIDIRRGEQQLFHAALAGSSADNDAWIERKCRLVRRFGVSSYLFGRRLAAAGKTFEQATLLDPARYAAHGGAFPVTVDGLGVVGTVAVSGLPQAEDHRLVVEVLIEFLKMTDSERLDGRQLDEWWDFDDPAGSAERFRMELPSLDSGSAAHAELRTQLARALALQHLPDQALAELDAVAAAGPTTARVTARLALERGRVHNSDGRAAEAVPYFLAAVDAARAAGDDFLLVDALHMLAIADRDHSDDWTLEALDVTDVTADERTRRWIGSLRNNLGWSLHDRGDHLRSLEQFESALVAYRATGTPEQLRIARWAVARALRALGRFDEAMSIQQELLTGPEDGYVQEELAELLLATGDAERARPYFAAAVRMLAADPWFDEPDRLARLRELGAPTGVPGGLGDGMDK